MTAGLLVTPQIRAVCLDADGVVVNPQMQFSKLLAAKHGISPEKTRDFFRGAFNDCLVDRTDLKEILSPFLQQWGWEGSVREFIDLWLATDHVIDRQVVDLAQALRQKGILCCLATSQERNRAGYMRVEMGFGELFDYLFFSCEIGFQKPDPRFYQHIEGVLGLGGGAVLFWDDSRKNVEAARELGWNAEIYTGFAEFAAVTKQYLGIEGL